MKKLKQIFKHDKSESSSSPTSTSTESYDTPSSTTTAAQTQPQSSTGNSAASRNQVTSNANGVIMTTNHGDITIALYADETPRTCTNFATLADQGYYDGLIFHRVISGFMLQGGDPTGTGMGGSSIYGEKFEDEIVNSLTHSGPGTLSMANSGPNTNGSQFFITLGPTPHLNGKHTVFGQVVQGLDVVEHIGDVQTDAQDKPYEEVKIIKARSFTAD